MLIEEKENLGRNCNLISPFPSSFWLSLYKEFQVAKNYAVRFISSLCALSVGVPGSCRIIADNRVGCWMGCFRPLHIGAI